MLKVTNISRGAERRLSAGTTILSLSWLNGRLAAVAIVRGEVTGRWSAPAETDDLTKLPDLLHEAVTRTGFQGHTAMMVLAHPKLSSQLIETPPLKGAQLEKVLERLVGQQKGFEGEAAWACEPSGEGGQNPTFLVHILPKIVLQQFISCCEKVGLRLLSATPVTSVLHAQIADLGGEAAEVALLAAETAGCTTLVVGKPGGPLLLSRTLGDSWMRYANRCALDLNRTVLFVNQRFGVSVKTVWVFGPGAAEQSPELQKILPVPVKPSPVKWSETVWAEEAAILGGRHAPNLISAEEQARPQAQLLLRVAGIAVLALLVCSVAAGLFIRHLAQGEREQAESNRRRFTELELTRGSLQRLQDDMENRLMLIRAFEKDQLPPAAIWFLGWLSESMPTELLLTDLRVTREPDVWRFQLDGAVQPIAFANRNTALADGLTVLTNALVSGPFRVELGAGSSAPPQNASPAVASFVSRLQPGRTGVAFGNGQFRVEGVFR